MSAVVIEVADLDVYYGTSQILFGVALSVKYTQSAGNARAYVDLITVNVYYGVGCEPTP